MEECKGTTGVVPILILDVYRVHMMRNIVNCIQSLGIEVIHIPAGCIIKSIKSGTRDKWEGWMIEGDGIVDSAPKEPSSKLVAEWVLDVYNNFPGQTARNAWTTTFLVKLQGNAWKKKGYEWC